MFRSHWTIIREHVDPSQSYHWPIIFTLHFGAAEACLYEVFGYVCIPLSMCIVRCYAVARYNNENNTIKLFISLFNQIDAQNLFHNTFYFMPHEKKICASSWLNSEINILRCTVSKTINILRCTVSKTINILRCKVSKTINILRCTVSKTKNILRCRSAKL